MSVFPQKMTPLLKDLDRQSSSAKDRRNGLPLLKQYLSEAKMVKNDSCILCAYKRIVYYYIITAHQESQADITMQMMEKENMNDRQKAEVRIVAIYCYQYAGTP